LAQERLSPSEAFQFPEQILDLVEPAQVSFEHHEVLEMELTASSLAEQPRYYGPPSVYQAVDQKESAH
jgi:hypothetical protein